VAHIRTEALCEDELNRRLAQEGDQAARWLYSSEALTWLHRELFRDLPAADLQLADGSRMLPGAMRERGVAVGRHEAPTGESLPRFLARWQQVCAGTRRGEASVVALAAAHHRLAWMHPFLDGNGRVTRLHTHLLLQGWGLTGGLWSPLRGFARTEARYKALLQAAGEHRRGNLTQAGLVEWITYTLEVCTDQVEFMAQQLHVGGMRDRIQAALAYETAVVKSGVREEALMPLHDLFATQGELGRADFKAMTGLGERVATSLLSALLHRGFLATDSSYGSLRFAIRDTRCASISPRCGPRPNKTRRCSKARLSEAAPRATPTGERLSADWARTAGCQGSGYRGQTQALVAVLALDLWWKHPSVIARPGGQREARPGPVRPLASARAALGDPLDPGPKEPCRAVRCH